MKRALPKSNYEIIYDQYFSAPKRATLQHALLYEQFGAALLSGNKDTE